MNASAEAHRLSGVRWRRAAAGVGLLLAVLGIAANGQAAGHTVQARNFEFVAPGGGSSLTVVVGDEVTWVASGDPHTITSGTPDAIDDRFVDRPATAGFLVDGDTFTTTFPTTGTYPYFCEVHFETMRGTVIVVAASTPVPTHAPTPRPTPVPTRAPTPVPTSTPAVTPLASPAASPTAGASPTASVSAGPSGEPGAPTAGSGPPDALPIAIAGLVAAIVLAGILFARRRGRAERP